MKTRNLFLSTFAFTAILLITSCNDNDVDPINDYGILPEHFKVDIPGSISATETKSAGFKSTQDDTLSGNEIYQHLRNFIAIGEGAADIVEDIIWGITIHKIDQIKQVTFVGEDDGRIKNLVVESGIEMDGRNWEYQLTLTDADSEGNEDGGIGLQVFWNKSPIEGIAILKPYNLNRKDDGDLANAMFKIEYSEAGTSQYEAYMIVEISDMPLPPAETDLFAVNTLKMYVGKSGDRVDVYGNSNHPNAQFNVNDTVSGFDWAFVASGFKTSDIAVAEVGLPSNTANISERNAILVENSIKKVLTREFTNYIIGKYPNLEGQETLVAKYIEPYLQNAEAPGYFNAQGFVQGGTAPSADYSKLESEILTMTPYNPSKINELAIRFK